MPKVALTDLGVDRLKKQGEYFDASLPGFGIRVGKNRKTWFVMRDRTRTRIRLGHYPELSLSEARKRAHGTPEKAPDPSVAFETAVDHFIGEHYRDKKDRTKSEAKRLLGRFEFEALGAITDREVSIQLGKLSNTPSEQLHAFRALRVFFRWSVRPPHRYISHSPMEGYPPPGKDKKGTRVLTDAELKKVWHACEGFFGDLIKLICLWGCRNGELGRLRRDWVENRVVTIPGAFTKNGRAHSIPILPMAKAILDKQPEGSDYFFPGHIKGNHFNDGSWGKLKQELDERSGVSGWQVRDLRRTFRSNLARLKVSRELAEIMLNHVTGTRNELDEIYNKYDFLDEKRDALKRLEAHMRKVIA